MKNSLLFAVLLVSVSCKPKPKPLSIYHLTIHTKEYSSDFQTTEKEDTIMAINDTLAYQSAYISYASKAYTEQKFKAKYPNANLSKTIDFRITDSSGTPIKYRLNKKVVDSIEHQVNDLINKMKQHSY